MTEWIPCEERLPEKDGVYNVIYNFGDISIGCFTKKNQPASKWNIFNVTHWAPLPEMPKKKRWRPKEDEKYFFISSNYDKIGVRLWVNKGVYWNDECKRSFLGVYKTKEEAELIHNKIKKFVESEIGEA